MGKRRNKKMINVLTASLASAVLLGTGTIDSLAFDDTTESTVSPTAQEQENSSVERTYTITLVTGDVVNVEKLIDGTLASTLKPREDGTSPSFFTQTIDGNSYLIPENASQFIASGQLDEELFNITKLVEYGYDDSHQSSIPLIVTEESGKLDPSVSEAAEEAVSIGATEKVELPSANAVAVKTNKKHAKKFWDAIDGEDTTVTKQAPLELKAGIKKIWLDRPVQALLDKSVPQIGAPTAWAAGYDGKGVKIAVLDTGIDPTHPDVKDAILEEKSFIDGQDYVDHHGHGTHVASTIAGTGAASGGKMKGVAPGAKLLIGKVLSNAGSGSESAVIAGMQWAVQEKADIISMSLGSDVPSDGTDPMSEAVNTLSETSNTLFVIAAGNSGSNGKGSIGSPGAAEKALTVGAVSKSDVLASFSSRGPLINNFKVKPEITAPGVGIVAARAAGTYIGIPIDANYTNLNGTSMATPHIAGAAAILKQRHPEWTGEHIKQVLAGTAVSKTPYQAYQQGGGRVDVVQALNANVYSSPAVVSMGASVDKLKEQTFKYVNPSDSDVTLNLALSANVELGGQIPNGLFSIDKTEVTIPAHGSSEVKVTFNPALLELSKIADYRAVVTATSSDGKKINTTIGASKTEAKVKLTLNRIDRKGNPAKGQIYAYNTDTGRLIGLYDQDDEYKTILELPPGHWSVMNFIQTKNEAGITEDYTLGGDTNVELLYKEEKALTIDARLGKEIKFATPKESVSKNFSLGYSQRRLNNNPGFEVLLNTGGWQNFSHTYVVPTGPAKGFDLFFKQRKFAPEIKASFDGRGGSIPLEPIRSVPKLDGAKTLKTVYIGKGSQEDLSNKDVHGKLVVVSRDEEMYKYPGEQIKLAENAGAEAVILVNPIPGNDITAMRTTDKITIPAWTIGSDDGAVLIDRITNSNAPTLINLKGIANSPYMYNLAMSVPGEIPADPTDDVTEENSEVVNTHYRSSKKSMGLLETNIAVRPGDSQVFMNLDLLEKAPLDREEWYSTGSKWQMKDMKWYHEVMLDVNNTARNMKDLRSYQPGTKSEDTWLGAAIGLVGPENPYTLAYRQGDNAYLSMLEFGDSSPGHYAWFSMGAWEDVATLRMYQDGKLLTEKSGNKLLGIKVPVGADPANYRITFDTTQTLLPVSTKTSTDWMFKSERPTNAKENLALLWPKYGFDLDMENKANGNSMGHFDLSFRNQSLETPDIQGVEVAVSTDDGNIWSNTMVEKQDNGHYTVSVKNPASGYVSLRVKAWDSKGSQVEQTTIRAYGVR
ncbi:S8 family peptidase [Gottfriedia acidiceleris]|uniref:S8 family peptidase n=1 Tax=Gottfriedia acidiceleris TaxID=371036 RepID=UPI0013EB9837|nr:S8 family serine peptidase [Gottfriedia acidiceleris]